MTNVTHMSDRQLDDLLALLAGEKDRRQEEKTVDLPEVKTVKLQCVGTAKTTGAQCTRTAIAGTTRCHLHPKDADAPTQAGVAGLTVKANRAGAHVAIAALDDALKAGTSLVYVRSNVGAKKVNRALRKRGYTVGLMRKDGDVRVWDVSGHGHTWEHRFGKYVHGQTEHHRQIVKVA